MDGDLNLLYVGKASTLGTRLGAYCAYAPDNSCRFKHEGYWSSRPRYLLTVGVPDEMAWEAAGLEEYLIRELDPQDNVLGRIPRDTSDS